MRAAKACSHPTCPNLQPCPEHKPEPWQGAKPARLRGRRHTRRRQRILRKYRGICHWCGKPGASAVEGGLTDHVIPLAEGGPDDESNMRPIHPACHDEKTQAEAQRGRGL